MKKGITTTLKLNSVGEWFIILALVLWVPSQIAIWVLPVWNPVAPDQLSWLAHWARDVGALVGATSAIATGLLCIRKHGFSLRRATVLSIGVAVSIICLSMSIYLHRTFISLMEPLVGNQSINNEIAEHAKDPTLPMQKRVKWSKMYASKVFFEEGIIVKSLNEDGQYADYEPTDKEVRNREDLRDKLKTVDWALSALRRASFLWTASLGVGIGLGLLWPVHREHENIQHPRDPDAGTHMSS